jgi:hypothetical protein
LSSDDSTLTWIGDDGTHLCRACGSYRLRGAEFGRWEPSPPPGLEVRPCPLCHGERPATVPSSDPQYCLTCRLATDFEARRRTAERRRREEAEAIDERRHRERLARLADPSEALEGGDDTPADPDPLWTSILSAIEKDLKRGRRPTNKGIAETFDRTERHISRLRKEHGYRSWEHLVASIRAQTMS